MKSRCQQSIGEILLEMGDRFEEKYQNLKKFSEILLPYRDTLPPDAVEILDKLYGDKN